MDFVQRFQDEYFDVMKNPSGVVKPVVDSWGRRHVDFFNYRYFFYHLHFFNEGMFFANMKVLMELAAKASDISFNFLDIRTTKIEMQGKEFHSLMFYQIPF